MNAATHRRHRRTRRRLARLRRAGRRTTRRLRRLRPRRRPGRSRPGTGDQAQTQPCRGAGHRDAHPLPTTRPAALRPRRGVRRLRVADLVVRRPARVQAAPGGRVSAAHRAPRGLRARPDPPHGRSVALPQQDGVLVRSDSRRRAAARPAPPRLLERDRRDVGLSDRLGAHGASPHCRCRSLSRPGPAAILARRRHGTAQAPRRARRKRRRPAAQPVREVPLLRGGGAARESRGRVRLHVVRRHRQLHPRRRRCRRRPLHAPGRAVPARDACRRRPPSARDGLPADEQRDVRSPLRDGARVRLSGRSPPRRRPLLRHRLSQPPAGAHRYGPCRPSRSRTRRSRRRASTPRSTESSTPTSMRRTCGRCSGSLPTPRWTPSASERPSVHPW